VIGYDVADALFLRGPIEIGADRRTLTFQVVEGHLTAKALGLFSLDSIVVMPLPAFQKYLQRQKRFRAFW